MAKIIIIGAGNVATHIAKRLYEKEHNILQIFNRSLENALLLAKEVDSTATNDVTQLNLDADFYIVAVSDDAKRKNYCTYFWCYFK